jgi:hypothetical protein
MKGHILMAAVMIPVLVVTPNRYTSLSAHAELVRVLPAEESTATDYAAHKARKSTVPMTMAEYIGIKNSVIPFNTAYSPKTVKKTEIEVSGPLAAVTFGESSPVTFEIDSANIPEKVAETTVEAVKTENTMSTVKTAAEEKKTETATKTETVTKTETEKKEEAVIEVLIDVTEKKETAENTETSEVTETTETEDTTESTTDPAEYVWDGPKLTRTGGVAMGPSGRETWYNLDMSINIGVMRRLGYDEENYPYWIREDGAKMLGPYVMCAANYEIRPRGTILPTSLGMGIVVDTGGFVKKYPYGLDICVDWPLPW